MDTLQQAFEERLQEIEEYLDFLRALEQQVQSGLPKLGGNGAKISVTQQKMLYSGVFLHLYNLIEATITRCLEAVCAAASEGCWHPGDLTITLRREWVRFQARTHVDLNYENRLQLSLDLCERLLNSSPVSDLTVERGGGGNWTDEEIEKIACRLGMPINLAPSVYSDIKRPFRNEMGPLTFIKSLRNGLAHGSLSFAECGESITVQELDDLKIKTASYLREIVRHFASFIELKEFIVPERRSARLTV